MQLPNYYSGDATYSLRVGQSVAARRHADGLGLERLLYERFPTEPAEIHRYRAQNLRPITRAYFDKALNALAGLYALPAVQAALQSLQSAQPEMARYWLGNNPDALNVWEWLFTDGLRFMLTEPNGVLAVVPKDFVPGAPPVLRYFLAEQVLTFSPQAYAELQLDADRTLLLAPQSVKLVQLAPKPKVTELSPYNYPFNHHYQNDLTNNPFNTVENSAESPNPLGYWTGFPAVLCGGEVYSWQYPSLYRSFFSGAFAFWDEAIIQWSEKQAGIKQHLFPEKWTFAVENCATCGGHGRLRQGGTIVECATCGGSGNPKPSGVFSVLSVPLPKDGSPNLPIPPAGYLQKDFSAIEFLQRDIYTNLQQGLAALNCEFLTQRPLSLSGRAKALDRTELDAFRIKIATHILHRQIIPLFAT